MTPVRNSNYMVNYRDPIERRHCHKRLPANRILFIIAVVSACASQLCGPSSATGDWDQEQWTDCWQSVTCAQCAARPSCSWSLRRQTCAGSSESSEGLRVHEPAACPSLAAVSRFVAADNRTYTYALRMTNAAQGFKEFLAHAHIRCDVAGVVLVGHVSGDTIQCDSTPVTGLWPPEEDDYGVGGGGGDEEDRGRDRDRDLDEDHSGGGSGDVIVRRARVTLLGSGVKLRPDNVADGYFAMSRRADCGRDSWDAECVTCARRDAAGTEYFVRCPGRNRCTGLFEYRDAWPPRPRRWSRGPGAPLSCGPDVRVLSVEPAAAPWTGGAQLRVTVRDRGVLAEKAATSVTVAGRACADLRVTLGAGADSVITCAVPPAAAAASVGGDGTTAAVRVRYALKHTVELAAAGAAFRYAYPEVVAAESTVRYGAGDGRARAEWTVRGALLDAVRRVRVTAGDEDVECENVTRPSPDRVVCTVAAAAAAAAPAVRLALDFDGALRVHAVLRPRWAVYVGEPAVDAGQSFRALASGDTALPVRGRRLLYATGVRFYADDGATAARYGACRVINDTYAACSAPRLRGAATEVGLTMEFAGRGAFRAPAAEATYHAYPDPVFTDFETDAASGTITVHGGGPDVAYSADDVTVRPSPDLVGGDGDGDGGGGGGGGEQCDVTAVYVDRIVCRSPLPPAVLERTQSVVVAVGDRLRVRVTVARKPAQGAGPSTASGSARVWAVLAVALGAVLAGVAGQVCLTRLRARRRRDEKTAAEAAAADRKGSDCTVRLTSSQCSSVDLTI